MSRSMHQARPDGDAQLWLTVFPGLFPRIGRIIHLRATLRSIGGIGMTLTARLIAALIRVLIDFGILALSAVPGTGGRSPVRRRRSGQSDMDGVKE